MTEEVKKSVFNEAVLQMNRLNLLQSAMNEFRINPFSRMHSSFQWDFELWSACLDGLYLEVSPKLTPTEDKEVMELLNEVKKRNIELLKVKDISTWGMNIHREKMWKIREALFDAEKTVRKFMDNHNLGSPNADDDSGDPYA